MLPLAAGLAALLLLLFAASAFLHADIRQLAQTLRRIAGVLLGLTAVGLAVMGRFGLALLAGGIAWALLSGRPVPRPAGMGRPPPSSGRMSRAEALKVLGLEESAGEEEIRAAHRRLILQAHPDKGGTSYLAAKINEAKDILLGS